MEVKPGDATRLAVRAGSLEELREAARTCRGCDLYRDATQTVFGRGRRGAPLLLVGEQPGDVEDRRGEPFVGPAGRVLAGALGDAGIDADDVYLTNAVKHFRWRPSQGGKRRLHDRPTWTQVGACMPWLEAEVDRVGPAVVACLGATAAQSVLGRGTRVGDVRGTLVDSPLGVPTLVTVHPSTVLRAAAHGRADAELAGLVGDLRRAARHAARRRAA